MKLKSSALTVILALGVLLVPLAADAQPAGKTHRVALIFTTSPVSEMAGPDPSHPNAKAFVRQLGELGYVEGRSIVIERRSAEGKFERFGEIIAELLRLNVSVIVTTGDAMTQRAKELTATVPIVMAAGWAPVENRLVTSLARPGGNVTGLTVDTGPEIEGKRLQLLKEAIPSISRVASWG